MVTTENMKIAVTETPSSADPETRAKFALAMSKGPGVEPDSIQLVRDLPQSYSSMKDGIDFLLSHGLDIGVVKNIISQAYTVNIEDIKIS